MKVIEVSIDNPDFKDYLKDESNISGTFNGKLLIPSKSSEISDYLSANVDQNALVVVSGKRTGLVGGAVPMNESANLKNSILISLERLNSISNFRKSNSGALIDVCPGTSLGDLILKLDEDFPEYFFPVDPTEKSASFGGMLATNASGSRGYRYGSVRNWVESIEVILVDGTKLELTRGRDKLKGLSFTYCEETYNFKQIEKPKTKNSIGYNYFPDMDLIDLFIGSEGTLGIITKISLRLIKKQESVFFVLQLFENYKDALTFIKLLRAESQIDTLSIEYFDHQALQYASKYNDTILNPFKDYLNKYDCSAVYFEVASTNTDFEFERINELVNAANSMMDYSVFAESIKDKEDLKRFRHAVPEGINKEIAKRKNTHQEIRKVATDMAVEDEYLDEVYELYKKTFSEANLEYVIFGHGGDNHFHVNILPRTNEEVSKAINCYESLAPEIIRMNGSVAAEHGIGRLKKNLLKIQYSTEIIEQMIKIKKVFDPHCRLNIGVLF